MKMMILLSALIFSQTALANNWIICGETANFEEGTVTGYELELSSEDDDYTGAVGGNWNLKLNQNGDWLKSNNNVIAQSLDKNGSTVVEIKIIQAKAASGPVGHKYVLTSLFDEEPTLEKFTMGGFAGTVKIATFKCVASYD